MKKETLHLITPQTVNTGNRVKPEIGKIHQKYSKTIVNHFTDKYFQISITLLLNIVCIAGLLTTIC